MKDGKLISSENKNSIAHSKEKNSNIKYIYTFCHEVKIVLWTLFSNVYY